MHIRKSKCNRVSVCNATWLAKETMSHVIKLAKLYRDDPEKSKRHKDQECPVCYYNKGRVGGAACTTVQCALCDEVMHYGNTCVDDLCVACAKKHNLCHHCGGDVDAVQRRRQREFDHTP